MEVILSSNLLAGVQFLCQQMKGISCSIIGPPILSPEKRRGRKSRKSLEMPQEEDPFADHYALIQNIHELYFPPDNETRPILPNKIVVSWTGDAKLFVLDEEVKSLDVSMGKVDELRSLILEISSESEYLFCHGIPKNEVGNYPNLLLKNVPYTRYYSKNCMIWFKPESSRRSSLQKSPRRQISKLCPKCSKSLTAVRAWQKKRSSAGEEGEERRTAANSRCSFNKLTEEDKEKRIQNMKKEKASAVKKVNRIVKRLQNLQEKLQTLSPYKMDPDEEVNEYTIIEEIMEQVTQELEFKECAEEFNIGAGGIMKEVEEELNKVLATRSVKSVGVQCSLLKPPVKKNLKGSSLPAIRLQSASEESETEAESCTSATCSESTE